MWRSFQKIFLTVAVLSSVLAAAQQSWKLKFYIEEIADGYRLLADSEELAPMSASFKFALTNMKPSLQDDTTLLIPAQAKRFVIGQFTVLDRKKSYRFGYSSTYNLGNVLQTDFDGNYIYDLPFEKGKPVRVDQGYNGIFSHQNQNALDFHLPEGAKIFAARDGKVVSVVEINTRHCVEKDCAKYNNKIIVLHSDGTFAEYVHLQLNGAVVDPGDMVLKGQHIGYSGNTGWSNGAHLHFSVFLNRMDGNRYYIPTKFRTAASSAELLTEKSSYSKNY